MDMNPEDIPFRLKQRGASSTDMVILYGDPDGSNMDEIGATASKEIMTSSGSKSVISNLYGIDNFEPGKSLYIFPKGKAYYASFAHAALPKDVDAHIYHNGKEVGGGKTYYGIPYGTEVKYVVNGNYDLIFEGDGNIIEPSVRTGQGAEYVFSIPSYRNFKLRRNSDRVSVNCRDDWKYFEIDVYAGGNMCGTLTMNGDDNLLDLPFDQSDNTVYTLQFRCPSGLYKVSGVTYTSGSGLSFDAATQTLTGVTDGVKLNLSTETETDLYVVRIY
ncbi:MAG: hypothetical protein K2K72_06655, partial [Duncaniella sp.]|nr:hypothetical protein [Duncaniella sp.]